MGLDVVDRHKQGRDAVDAGGAAVDGLGLDPGVPGAAVVHDGDGGGRARAGGGWHVDVDGVRCGHEAKVRAAATFDDYQSSSPAIA